MKQKKSNSFQYVNQVKIEFTAKPITAWGGVASLVAKFLEKIDFRGWVETHFPIVETSNNSKGIYEKVLGQFLTVLVGGRRFAHLQWWEHGREVLLQTFGVKWLPQAASTQTRFWGKINRPSLSQKLGEGARGLVGQLLEWEGITEDNLNLDSTVLTRYGEQEGAKRGYNPHKPGRPSHHPLLAFLGAGYIVNLWNRSGDTHSGQRAKDFFLETIASLGGDFRVQRVICDSGFYEIHFIEYLEREGYCYIIAVPLWEILQSEIRWITHWQQIEEGLEVAEFYFQHLDRKWTRPRRYVVVRQEVARRPKATGKQLRLFQGLDDWKGYRFSLMITNDSQAAPEEIWREYRPRANDENVLKDLKEGYAFAAFNLHNFWATEAVMLMNALVFHNLIHYLNRKVLQGNQPQPQMKTLRSRYFILPAVLGSGGGYQVLRLGVRDRSLRGKIWHFLQKIQQLPYNLNCNAVATRGP